MDNKEGLILEDMTLDRQVNYNGIEYQIVEILNSDMLLVVKKEDFNNKIFPLVTYIIPGQ